LIFLCFFCVLLLVLELRPELLNTFDSEEEYD